MINSVVDDQMEYDVVVNKCLSRQTFQASQSTGLRATRTLSVLSREESPISTCRVHEDPDSVSKCLLRASASQMANNDNTGCTYSVRKCACCVEVEKCPGEEPCLMFSQSTATPRRNSKVACLAGPIGVN